MSAKARLKILAVCLAVVTGPGATGTAHAASPSPILERIVVVERHGVRAPTKTAAALSKYSAQAWPEWSVPVGELTAHGAANIRLMGAWLRAHYAEQGLWPATGCPAARDAYAWADGADQRTRASGDAFLEGAFPGCGLAAHHGAVGAKDAVFDAVATGACPIDPKMAQDAVLARVNGDLDKPGAGYEADKAALRDVLDPPATRKPCADSQGVCFLNGHNALSVKDGELRLDGPLATASTLTESLLLEYAEGLAADAVGWGRADSPAKLAAVMGLHDIETDLMRRTPYLASHNAALLARAVADALDGRPALPEQGESGRKLVLIAGHDTNLSNLAGVLGVDWTLEGQPDKTPPGAALVFEVWRDPASGARTVRVMVVYQTLEQLRAGTVLDDAHPARRVAVALPGCVDGAGGACTIGGFRKSIETAIPANCRR